ncbi:translation initiation factor IF-3 [Burkholderia cepacia]|nr:translation initiation factor IF-3 [Burkholderia cepacia]
MRLVGIENEPLGIVKLADAFRKSEELDVDLVEIAPQAVPPVCRLMDYGKFKYQESKKQHEAKLKQKVIQVKEVKFRPGTDDGDYNVKLRNLVRFLEEGDKTKITLRFRGREMAHQEIGMRMLERLRTDLEEVGQVEQMPKMEGRQMIMVLSPKKRSNGPARFARRFAVVRRVARSGQRASNDGGCASGSPYTSGLGFEGRVKGASQPHTHRHLINWSCSSCLR